MRTLARSIALATLFVAATFASTLALARPALTPTDTADGCVWRCEEAGSCAWVCD